MALPGRSLVPEKIRFTARRLATLICPPGRPHLTVFDLEQPGLAVRVTPRGTRTLYAVVQVGSGATRKVRWIRLGAADKVPLSVARLRVRELGGEAARGRDVVAERRRAEAGRLAQAIAAWKADLDRRRVVDAARLERLLRSELLDRLGDIPLAELDRRKLLDIRDAIAGKFPAKAEKFRSVAGRFLNWAVAEDLIPASPLAGYRRPRATRAERIERPGRALEDRELGPWWRAVEASPDPIFRVYLRVLLLTGLRRTEAALATWSGVDVERGWWTIAAETTKTGREHRVPITPELARLLEALPRLKGCDLVFPGRRGRPMSGWSRRLRPVYAATAAAGLAPWTLHDLRRTFRTGLARLGVPFEIAERALNHSPRSELAAIYDRAERLEELRDAFRRWAEHVARMIDPAEVTA